jgi:glycosyltransferase involved in cell wall biosynthesis
LNNSRPPVGIGIPVFNGENYLSEAINSVLDQSYADLEVFICDNASTDKTEDICREFARKDPRIHYVRNTENIGAAKNYDLVWHRSENTFFKWLAHDDRLLPNFVEQTVEVLEADSSIILCNGVVDYIDEHGEHMGYYKSVIRDADSDDPAARFAAIILRMHTCVDFFGMIKREFMVGSLLHQAYRGSDRAFLAQMALRGRFFQIASPLVQMRQHPNQYSKMKNVRQQLAWQDPDRERTQEIAVLRMYKVYKELVASEVLSETDRNACRNVLRRFWFQSWPIPRLAAELLSVPFPSASSIFRSLAIKLKLAGSPDDLDT